MPSRPCDLRHARICDDFRSLGVPTTASQHSRLSSRRTAPKCHHDVVHHCSSASRRCVPYQRLGHPLWLRLIYYRSHQDPPLRLASKRAEDGVDIVVSCAWPFLSLGPTRNKETGEPGCPLIGLRTTIRSRITRPATVPGKCGLGPPEIRCDWALHCGHRGF
jgi:hypothetical protein